MYDGGEGHVVVQLLQSANERVPHVWIPDFPHFNELDQSIKFSWDKLINQGR
jgi:hypothetical protein